jgi:hypothetical protein
VALLYHVKEHFLGPAANAKVGINEAKEQDQHRWVTVVVAGNKETVKSAVLGDVRPISGRSNVDVKWVL